MADDTFTLDELHQVTVPEGRCPHCGRPSAATEAKVFSDLRQEAASAVERAKKAEAKVDKLTDERDALKVRNADLRADNKELRAT